MKNLFTKSGYRILSLIVVAAIIFSGMPMTAAAEGDFTSGGFAPGGDVATGGVTNGGLTLDGGDGESCVCTAFCDDPDYPVCKDDHTQCAFYYCVCEALCGEGSVNADCPVCKDDYTKCVQAVEVPEIEAYVATAVANTADLNAAIAAFNGGSADMTIEITASFTTDSTTAITAINNSNAAQKLTITSSSGSIKTITRGKTGDLITVIQGELILQNITVDGGNGGVFSSDGGGSLVYVLEYGKLTMTDGATLQNNTRSGNNFGGGVANDGTFNMSGGEIKGNVIKLTDVFIGSGGGGGVYNLGTFNMSGGKISGNAADFGGGVYVLYGTLNISGSPKIVDNKQVDDEGGENPGGVYLSYACSITIDSPLTDGAHIGIEGMDDTDRGAPVATDAVENDLQYFYISNATGEVGGYDLVFDRDYSEIVLGVPHWADYGVRATNFSSTSTNQINITSEAELGLFAYNLLQDSGCYDGYTITLKKDLDLSERRWMPVAMEGGIFEGGGHSITGLTVKDMADLGNEVGAGNYDVYSAGMFSRLDLTIVRNLTFIDPVVNVSYNPYEESTVAGVVAGITFNAEIREVIILEPDVKLTYEDSSYMSAYLGGVVGYADNGETDNSVGLDMTIIKSCEVHGGNITVNGGESSDLIYVGGIAGLNYQSYIATSSVYFTNIKVQTAPDCYGLYAGGITGMTSTGNTGNLGSYCLLGNLSMAEFELSDSDEYYVGGIAGMVDEDSVVNNLYIGDLYVDDEHENYGLFGYVDEGGFTVSHNYAFETVEAAWASGAGNGAYIATLNDTTSPDGGFYVAADVINGDTGWDWETSLSMLRVWKTYPDSTNKYGYAAHTPYLGAYYGAITSTTVTVTAPTTGLTYGDTLGDPSAVAGDTVDDADYTYTYTGILADGSGTQYNNPTSKPTEPGTYTVTATLVSATHEGSGYADFTIAPKSLTWKTGGTASSKTYDGTATAAQAIAPTLNGIINSDTVSVQQGTLAFANANAGTGKAVNASGYGITGIHAWKYNAPTAQPGFGTADITAKSVIITPDAGQSKVYGQADPTLTYATSEALIAGNNFSGALSRTAGESVGRYAITLGTLGAGSNYTLFLNSTPAYFTINRGTGNVGGTVTDENNAPLQNKTVEIRTGGTTGTLIRTAQTDTNGIYSFMGLPYSVYSLIVYDGTNVVTRLIIINQADITENVKMPSGNQNTHVEVKGSDTPSVAAANLEQMFTPEDKAAAQLGAVEIKLVVEVVDDPADANIILQNIGGQALGFYFDAQLLKTITGAGAANCTDDPIQPPPGTTLKIVIDVPTELQNMAPYSIIRVHNGVAKTISAVYDSELHTLTFEADLFSTYAIAYTQKNTNPPNPPSSGGGSSSGGDGGSGGGTASTIVSTYWIEVPEATTMAKAAKEKELDYVCSLRATITGIRKNALLALAGLRYQHDTVADSAVQVRVYVDDPAKAAKDILVSGYVKGNIVDTTKAKFGKWYTNKNAVISFDQQGDFGMIVQIAAKVDLSGMDTNNLNFYGYDRQANKYSRIDTEYRIDANGYLHFATGLAGDIIVSNGPLAKKTEAQITDDGSKYYYLTQPTLESLNIDGGDSMLGIAEPPTQEIPKNSNTGGDSPSYMNAADTPLKLEKVDNNSGGALVIDLDAPLTRDTVSESLKHDKISVYVVLGITSVLLLSAMMLWAVVHRKNDPLVSVEEFKNNH